MRLEELKKIIKRYHLKLQVKKIVIFPHIPPELEELQQHIIHSHLEVDKLMAEMIRVKLWATVYNELNPFPSMKLMPALYQVVEYIPYRNKIRILRKLEPLFNPLVNRINNFEEIRNKFVHTELRELLKEYNTESLNGAQKILAKYELIEELMNDILSIGEKVKDYSKYIKFLDHLKKVKEK